MKQTCKKWRVCVFYLGFLLLTMPFVMGYSVNDFFSVVGEKGTQDISCLGKPIPTSNFRVGDEESLGPNAVKKYCCQRFSIHNPFLFTSFDVSKISLNPYVEFGDVSVYYADLKSETFTTSKGNITQQYLEWTKGIKSYILDNGLKFTMLICSEKDNILQKKKWGTRISVGGYVYDLDPVYNPAGTNAFHPNATNLNMTGGNGTNVIKDNQTLNLTFTYQDYCGNNECVANDSLSEVFRFDNSGNGNNGTTGGNGGTLTFVRGVFGGSTGSINISKETGMFNFSVNSTSTVTNLTGSGSFGFGGWFNITCCVGGNYIFSTNTEANLDTFMYVNLAANRLDCGFENATKAQIQTSKSSSTAMTGEWKFLYCQKNATHICAYVDDQVPTCTATNTGDVHGFVGTKWVLGGQDTTAPGIQNISVDEFQFRKEALNNANISQWYYDGLHRLSPTAFSSNNSRCEWYVQNSSGVFLGRNETLGFNSSSCLLNGTLMASNYNASNNISVNFTPVNNFEAGVTRDSGRTVFIITSDTNVPPNVRLDFPGNNSVFNAPVRINFSFRIVDDVNLSLIGMLIINGTQNVSNSSVQNNTLTNLSAFFVNAQAGNYTWDVNGSDGKLANLSNETRTFEIRGTSPQFVTYAIEANTSVLETSNQTFFLNVSYNTSLINLSVNFTYAGLSYNGSLVSSVDDPDSVHASFNLSRFKANIVVNLTLVNNTAQDFQFHVNASFLNGTNESHSRNSTQNVTFAYLISAVQRLTNVTEGRLNVVTNFTLLVPGSIAIQTIWGEGKLDFNGSNHTAIIHQENRSVAVNFTATVNIPMLTSAANQQFSYVPYVNLSFNHSGRPRDTNISRSAITEFNTTISQLNVSNCSIQSGVNDETLNVTIRDETSNAVLQPASVEMFFVLFREANSRMNNRTFNIVSRNNGSFHICYRPVFDTVKADFDWTITNDSYSQRSFSQVEFNLSNATQTLNLNLFLISNTSLDQNTVIITVVDQDDQALEGRVVEIRKFDPNNQNESILESKKTRFDGKVQFQVITKNTFYRIKVLNKQDVELYTNPFEMISPFAMTFRIVIDEDKTISHTLQLFTIPKTLRFDNATRNITFNYSDPNKFLERVCMTIRNGTLSNFTWFHGCITNASDRLSFNVGQNRSVFVVDVVAEVPGDQTAFLFAKLFVDTIVNARFLFEGLIATFFVVGIVSFAFLFNPATAMIAGAGAFLIMGVMGFHMVTIGTGIGALVFALILGWFMKT